MDDDDSEYQQAAQRAARATRRAWSTLAWTTGALGCTLIAVALLCMAAVVACLYVVVTSHY
ncbi:hypothetical protein G3I32_30140 [Streptomyces coelicoflavus]|uniref:Uncharacterized protein n=1 Tax=Streptomyces coelicoflavus TaxID=285562 RepID=A0A7K3PVL4_9ACTN|nr:hypothetical protein [Streptomyces coelicoflavus]NEB13045.1 hypothetical protein [Streptomyces coelicoflavus]